MNDKGTTKIDKPIHSMSKESICKELNDILKTLGHGSQKRLFEFINKKYQKKFNKHTIYLAKTKDKYSHINRRRLILRSARELLKENIQFEQQQYSLAAN